jgi:hypothetical protein
MKVLLILLNILLSMNIYSQQVDSANLILGNYLHWDLYTEGDTSITALNWLKNQDELIITKRESSINSTISFSFSPNHSFAIFYGLKYVPIDSIAGYGHTVYKEKVDGYWEYCQGNLYLSIPIEGIEIRYLLEITNNEELLLRIIT